MKLSFNIPSRLRCAGAVAAAFLFSGTSPGATPESSGLDFFENKIRPLLIEHCYECHSAAGGSKPKGGLALDTRDGLLHGGGSGPVIVPGDPGASLLIRAVRYLDKDLQMPPEGKRLSAEQVNDLVSWIEMGAPDPRTGEATPLPGESAGASHWAFQPVQFHEPPKVRNAERVQSPIDAFILARLEEKGMDPAPMASRRTLIRRASLDVTGLPPTPAEVEEFINDPSPDAFNKVIERLLGSPHYGERWARHWLDVARYADTKGYVFEEERRFPYSYTYRDYVIRAFNQDLPYDQFLVEQIAADLLDLGEDKRPLAALGFLTLGRRFLNNQHDIIDDRIDVVTRGTMGLTVGCARCHDHKYDPIPIEDYYSLYGVFASSSEPDEKPLLGADIRPEGYDEYVAEREKRSNELTDFQTTKTREALIELKKKSGDYLLAAFEGARLENRNEVEKLARERKLDPGTVRRWIDRLESWSKNPDHTVFGPWFAFASLTGTNFADQAAAVALKLSTGQSAVNPLVRAGFTGAVPESFQEVAERYGKLFADVEQRWQDTLALAGKAGVEVPAGFADPSIEELRLVLYGPESPVQLNDREIFRLFDVPTAQRIRALRRKLEELDATHPGAPPRAMALRENAKPHNPHVFLRGNPNNRGPEVPRQFLAILAGPDRKPFAQGGGRLELAREIASRDNPLTARVLVNRIWMQYFGNGLVRTTSDFGLRAEPPTHPELLDYLAWRFMEDGWSIKSLHRLILSSSTYQQSHVGNAAYAEIDPNNFLLSRMNRRRLDLEGMRDSLLAVANNLNLKSGGHPVEIANDPAANRRTIYGFIERQNLPGLFRTFDFASPDTTSPRRFSTTVPQQALFMINSPFVIRQARKFAAEFADHADPVRRIRAMYMTAYQRPPSEKEIQWTQSFLKLSSTIETGALDVPAWKYGYGNFDPESGKVEAFTEFPHFTGKAWQGGNDLPDPQLGWAFLNNEGGHPGEENGFDVIRRWTAPAAVLVDVRGSINHGSENGDGVHAFIVSSRQGTLGTWNARDSRAQVRLERIAIEPGEILDFVVSSGESVSFDGFSWAPTIRLIETRTPLSYALPAQWSAKDDFSGPQEAPEPLSPWEQFAQVLLMSNEFIFVD